MIYKYPASVTFVVIVNILIWLILFTLNSDAIVMSSAQKSVVAFGGFLLITGGIILLFNCAVEKSDIDVFGTARKIKDKEIKEELYRRMREADDSELDAIIEKIKNV
jgi:hypothetical protein